MTTLDVYLGEARVGTLTDPEGRGMVFSYEESWLDQSGAIPISRQLPLGGETFKGRGVENFFKGVLPEEEPRLRIASILGISSNNDFAMLERIGGECAGAVNLWPEGQRPAPGKDVSPRELSPEELADILAELPRRPLMAGEAGVRLSLAGAQSKLPVLVRPDKAGQERVALPMGKAASSHILKPEPDRFPGLVANEYYCMSLAAAVGLNVPGVRYEALRDIPYLLVERYDRVVRDGDRMRVHQEDFCQALGIAPERKYQQEGGPSLLECIHLLRDWSTVPVLDIRAFIDGIIFNVLIGNADAHAKNFSILYPEKDRRLAPFYDLVCTMARPELSRKLSMKIGPAAELNEVTPDHFRIFSEQAHLGWPMVRGRLKAMCETVHAEMEREALTSALPEPDAIEPVKHVIRTQTKRIQKLLGS